MELTHLSTLGVVFVVIAITLSMGAYILDQISSTGNFETGSVAYNSTVKGGEAIQTIVNFLPIVALVVVAAVVIGIVASSFSRTQTA